MTDTTRREEELEEQAAWLCSEDARRQERLEQMIAWAIVAVLCVAAVLVVAL